VKRNALIIFADAPGLDLARRSFPKSLRPLFDLRALRNLGTAADIHLFTSGNVKEGRAVHRQQGATFAARLEAAVDQMAQLGYDKIVMIGRDCPRLHPGDIATAFRELAQKRLVLGPDHRGGCYLIGLRANERGLLRGIRWRRDTDCRQLCERCASGTVALLATKQDVDTWSDLRLLARSDDRPGRIAAAILEKLLSSGVRRVNVFVDCARRHACALRQMPPPAVAW
jgi:glycosyltransferase A (GT-A) superfamily protein (DUF2064 family)